MIRTRSPYRITSSSGEPGPVIRAHPPSAGVEVLMTAAGIGLLIFAHVADYATFMVMVARHGLGSELNPLVATIFADWGLPLLTVAKFATVLLVATVFLIVGRTHRRMAGGVLIFGVFIGALGAMSNLATI